MPSGRICGQCGAEVNEYSAEGLCPQCMLLGGIGPPVPGPVRPAAPSAGSLKATVCNFSPAPGRPCYFGDYELLAEIARGGMGVVYQARQLSLNRRVALKMILSAQLADAVALQRFLAEAETAANLRHPNIVAIYEVGEHEGQHYFTMEYVEGESLAALVREHPLSAARAAQYLRRVAEAIQYAHEHGTLHRDLKPSNVLIDSFDQPRVTDFGLAKQVQSDSALTVSGQVLGTPSFMPPEQAAGERAVAGSDVYSLGAMLYHLLTGRPPFVAPSLADTLRLVAEAEPVSPRALNPSIPRDLDTICLKCLEKNPAKRYPSARAFADELDRFLRDEPIAARPVPMPEKLWRRCRRKPIVASLSAGLILIFVLGLAGVLSQWRRAERNAENESAQRRRTEQLNLNLQIQRAESFLGAGDVPGGLGQLARLLRQSPTNQILAERLFSALNQRNFPLPLSPPLQHQAAVRDAKFSPDGLRVVTASDDNTARVWDALTGQPLTPPLRHEAAVRSASFSPDGAWILTRSTDETAQVWGAQTAQKVDAPLGHAPITSAQFSPDGKRWVTSSRDRTVRVWETASGQLLLTIPHEIDVTYAEFSPDGQRLVTSGAQSSQVWDAGTGKPTTKPFGNRGYNSACFSPDGQRIATTDNQGSARLWEARTGEPLCPLVDLLGGYVKQASFSPDGQLLLVVYQGGVQVLDAHTGKPRLSGTAWKQYGEFRAAEFSPDGLFILSSAQDRTAVVRDARTGQDVFEPIRHPWRLNAAHFSPDGQRVVTASQDKTARVWDVRHGQPLPLTFRHDEALVNGISAAHFSPDGRKVLTASLDHSANVWDAQTAKPQLSPAVRSGRIYGARFSPDGQWLATFTVTPKVYETRSMQAVPGPFGPVPNPRNQWIWWVNFSPDSRRLVSCGPDDSAHIWEARTGQALGQPMGHKARVYFAEFSSDGQKVVTASEDGTARVWNALTGEPMGPPLQHDDKVNTASFASDGQRIVTASTDETARIWDAATGKELLRVRHHNEVQSAEFSPDGTRVLTASLDTTARVWDSRTGQPLGEPLQHESRVVAAHFSPDGQRVITSSTDRTARVWDARTGQPLTDPFRFEGKVAHGEFSPEGERVLVASGDGSAAIWPVPRAPVPVPDWLLKLAEALGRPSNEPDAVAQGTPHDEWGDLKSQSARGGADDFYSRWARWFFADRSTRTISAFSTVTLPDYIQRHVYSGTLSALREAARLSPTNVLVLARLAWAMAYEERAIPASLVQADFLSRRALQLAPADANIWEARAAVLDDINLSEALEAMQRAIDLAPASPGPWNRRGLMLAETNRLDEAYQSFSQAISLAEATPGFSKHERKQFLADRRDLLVRMGRIAEAGVDNCRRRDIPQREAQTRPELLDLSAFYNWLIIPDGVVLEPGLHRLAGVDFDVRAAVQVASLDGNAQSFPKEIKGIPVGRKVARCHFLHATSGAFSLKEVTTGSYVIHFADGQQAEIPLVFGRELGPFYSSRPGFRPTAADVAWTGSQAGDGKEVLSLQLFKFTWENPRPEVEVRAFDVISAEMQQAPSLLAVTVE